MTLRKLVAGNWKMHGRGSSLAVVEALAASHPSPACDVLICPPATLITRLVGRGFAIGGQDCHWEPLGAHTGDIAAEMLAEAGAVAVIVGHSERRADHGETDATVALKATAAWRAGLLAVICVGETEAERDSGQTLASIAGQLANSVPETATADNLVIAYEPVWAIGTGRTPSLKEIAEVHDFIRESLETRFGCATSHGIRLLYGGSVKPSNAAEIFAVPNVDGALVGGASLKAEDFGAIIAAAG
ncbi:triose-phosphate isomerase [Amaricoccus sp.]|uniref:triose-phosphate isomerase n=1 Tax=Amaricoccus sp. TaxID=1872485 RepID=UPI0026066AD4|nr:triose-phosphate isomerase [uncultured Amaricoccus sp.]